MVHRVYVEKKPAYAVRARQLEEELRSLLGLAGLERLSILRRYDVEGIDGALFARCVDEVFSEPPVDTVYVRPPRADFCLGVEYLPGQFDQRAESAAECISLISMVERPCVRSADVYLLWGEFSESERAAVEKHLINPVEARKAAEEKPDTLLAAYPAPPDVPLVKGFTELEDGELPAFAASYGLAMDADDLAFCRGYFRGEGRQPTVTELRVLDTYWSDHCRHTTFCTHLRNISIEDESALATYKTYLELRERLYGGGERPQTLMDLATIGAKAIKAAGGLRGADQSDEINACGVIIKADNGGAEEDWLLLFKNETHNHPTEIEPFGGAATCIGGAIRDPLSGRGYVFGAMRVTGAANPLAPVRDTLPGKLPQRKLCVTAAAGYSSYGNQIGLATGEVTEIYHPGYVAKRMEIGAVLGAVPLANVRREAPRPGDAVLLLGGATGRDGCGGATGSSKAHGQNSLEDCGAEVQKGNAPTERKLQRLFRNPRAARLVRRCNDFGAGGVSVAVGELADGLDIDLSAVPKKYDGLNGTELAISESQERMAVVVAEEDTERFMAMAAEENLAAARVAAVTESPRLVMRWRGKVTADISREFLNSGGAAKRADVRVPPLPAPVLPPPAGGTAAEKLMNLVRDLNHCSQKGLAERFDSTVGAGTVLMPFGGRYQLTPAGAMVMKLPTDGETDTCAGMAFGFNPYVSQQNPYAGAYLAVVESVAKLCARGFALCDITLTFQEYFGSPRGESERWGLPFAALLGALQAQLDFGVAAIGGKDSMSGSFEQMDVPPTLVSFAVAHGSAARVTSAEFRLPRSKVVLLRPRGGGLVPSAEGFLAVLGDLRALLGQGKALAVCAAGAGGIAGALQAMCAGNRVGFDLAEGFGAERLFGPAYGSFIVELDGDTDIGETLGETRGGYALRAAGEVIDLAAVEAAWRGVLEPVYPTGAAVPCGEAPALSYEAGDGGRRAPAVKISGPRALIPVFPGTNCEYDTAKALRRAGARPEIFVLRNLSPRDVAESAERLAAEIDASQMVVLPGGFSGGDEPDGSAKLITAFFRQPRVAEAVAELLGARDGLMLGICNGFQALIKLGLVPFGEIRPANAGAPTLTFNSIGRHQSMLSRTRVASTLSPWLAKERVGEVHTVAVSHGEGRFVADEALLRKLAAGGQIATQYADESGAPCLSLPHNPNGSVWAVEGITSPDGRVMGKMGHTERIADSLYLNVPGNKYQRLFEGGVGYFAL